MAKLRELGLEEYFLYPQINWNSKAASIAQIAKTINIGLDAVAFIDDQPFEREEVAFTHGRRCSASTRRTLDDLLGAAGAQPASSSPTTRSIRRRMYLADIARNRAEAEYVGPTEEFLATLG
jgi:FkbH-like protein